MVWSIGVERGFRRRRDVHGNGREWGALYAENGASRRKLATSSIQDGDIVAQIFCRIILQARFAFGDLRLDPAVAELVSTVLCGEVVPIEGRIQRFTSSAERRREISAN